MSKNLYPKQSTPAETLFDSEAEAAVDVEEIEETVIPYQRKRRKVLHSESKSESSTADKDASIRLNLNVNVETVDDSVIDSSKSNTPTSSEQQKTKDVQTEDTVRNPESTVIQENEKCKVKEEIEEKKQVSSELDKIKERLKLRAAQSSSGSLRSSISSSSTISTSTKLRPPPSSSYKTQNTLNGKPKYKTPVFISHRVGSGVNLDKAVQSIGEHGKRMMGVARHLHEKKESDEQMEERRRRKK
ncbi:hypothetical protein BKA69DRAFT_1126316 [Paraphysoderma sedebokerense]|nr:hypothetical protein BKA69DRAFT_1126316 [Paraphysoderma sedebokerense]